MPQILSSAAAQFASNFTCGWQEGLQLLADTPLPGRARPVEFLSVCEWNPTLLQRQSDLGS